MLGFRRELFNLAHLDLMELRPQDQDGILKLPNIRERLALLSKGLAMTLIYDGRPVACMGFVEILPGVADGWIIPSIYVKNIPKLFAREVRWYIEAQAKTFKWHRVQTLSRLDEGDQRWMEFLGFHTEGVLKCYLDRVDFAMSARYFDWGGK